MPAALLGLTAARYFRARLPAAISQKRRRHTLGCRKSRFYDDWSPFFAFGVSYLDSQPRQVISLIWYTTPSSCVLQSAAFASTYLSPLACYASAPSSAFYSVI